MDDDKYRRPESILGYNRRPRRGRRWSLFAWLCFLMTVGLVLAAVLNLSRTSFLTAESFLAL
jgi:hypothetical protein